MARRGFRLAAAAGVLSAAAGCAGQVTIPAEPGTGGSTSTASTGTTSGTGGRPLLCPAEYCPFGDGGYAFAIADSDAAFPFGNGSGPSSWGKSRATLATDGTLCTSGEVMALTPNPGLPPDAEWGTILGVDLNQAMGASTPANPYTPSGTGITFDVNFVPSCTQARVLLDMGAGAPLSCAELTPGVEIPWATFNTSCWNGMGLALSGPPSSRWIGIWFVPGEAACPFTDFCITGLSL
jgi:hypothetical protein